MRWCHLFLPPIHFASFFFCLSPQKKYLEVGRASHFPREGSFGRSVGGYFSNFLALPSPPVNEEGAWEDYAQHLHPSLALPSKLNRNKHRLVKIDAKKDFSKVLFFKFFRGEGAKRHSSKLRFFFFGCDIQQERDLYGGNTRISPETSFEYLKITPPEPIKFLFLRSSWEMEGRRRSAKLWSNSLSLHPFPIFHLVIISPLHPGFP